MPTGDSTVTPVIQLLLQLPLSLRDEVEEELHRLVKEDIIELVNTSCWVSNLVVASKKTGNLRLYVRLMDFNKVIIPDKYPLPSAEE